MGCNGIICVWYLSPTCLACFFLNVSLTRGKRDVLFLRSLPIFLSLFLFFSILFYSFLGFCMSQRKSKSKGSFFRFWGRGGGVSYLLTLELFTLTTIIITTTISTTLMEWWDQVSYSIMLIIESACLCFRLLLLLVLLLLLQHSTVCRHNSTTVISTNKKRDKTTYCKDSTTLLIWVI